MKLRIFIVAAAFFAGQFSMSAVMAQESTLDVVKKRGTLDAGVRYDMPPYGYIGDGGSVTGIDIEIVNAIAKKLGVKVDLKQVTAQTRIPMLTSRQHRPHRCRHRPYTRARTGRRLHGHVFRERHPIRSEE